MKNQSDNQTLSGADLLSEYIRLVNYGEPDLFLDYDTTLVIDYREELEGEAQQKILTDDEIRKLHSVDEILKTRVNKSLESYKKKIESQDKTSDYLRAVLLDLSHYGKDEPKSKWWFHLFD